MAEHLDVDALTEGLEAWLGDALGTSDVGIGSLRRLSGGSSRENWAFELTRGDSTDPMLLRRDPVASVADTERAIEVGVIEALADTPVPAPVIVASDLAGNRLGRAAVIMQRSPGQANRAALRSRDPLGIGDEGRLDLAGQLADLLASVHAIDVGRFDAVFDDMPSDPAAHEIAHWEAEVARVRREPQPELAYLAAWLDEHRPPPPARPCLVHGDFRPANVLVGDDGRVTALLDWEFAHLGDPAEDLGWYTTPLYAREHCIPDAWSADDFLDRCGAGDVSPERLHFWQVLALFKLSAIALAGVASFLDGQTDRAAGPIDGLLRIAIAATRAPIGNRP